ncbi:hypothetical protein [Mycolicibacter longobardus]|uniref:Proline rich protein n=1 Tax=Mycolicibacter longobardus TaxID=1108812 RepID=A0A1X1YEY3_9MYCO|nr:hypothetical protein [Mycolicibacter longobardus]MCV7385975.1 hypothetical protein [Mycolicibacter longobardus]ORW09692.1 hypothetical protein AWC16_15920 [Mycolicibacter longobardus]
MSETPGTTATPPVPPGEPKPYWLYRLAAWVVTVAGIVFIVLSIFFAGVWASNGGPRGHHCHGHHGHHAMFHKGPHRGPGPMGPGPDRPGPGELPPPGTQSPAPTPGR